MYISSVGRILFPQLAEFCFLSWPKFITSVGFSFLGYLEAYHETQKQHDITSKEDHETNDGQLEINFEFD